MKDQSEYNVRAVERAILILECFDSENPERGVSEIAQTVGLHKATTHRIVTTLLNHGFLERADDDQRYRPGLKLASLGFQVLDRMNVRQESLPYMKQLVEQWNESCDLSIYDQEQAFYVEVLHGSHALTISAAIGQRLPVHCTASGKIFLAHLDPKEINRFLSKPLRAYTSNTITSPDKLRTELQTIRQQGYSYDDEEFEDGIRAIAAPIKNHRSEVIAALSIPGPINRIIEERKPDLVDALLRATQAISQRMGWNI